MLTHTLHLPPALSEIYDSPRPGWLREVLEYLPCLQSLIVSRLPFFDHNAMVSLKGPAGRDIPEARTYNVHLLVAEYEPNTTSQGLAEMLVRFPALMYLDLSYTRPARDRRVLSMLSLLEHLQVLKLRGIGLKDNDAQCIANAIGTRVRFLDLRSNYLTDVALRSLLQASFQHSDRDQVGWDVGGQTWDSMGLDIQATSPLSNSELPKRSDLDQQLLELFTRPLTNRYWVGNLAHAGITHLYVADNPITVEGVASLLASTKLHALDVGAINTAEALARAAQPVTERNQARLPGPEKLVPLLVYHARDRLRYLRVHHALITAEAPVRDASLHALLPELSASAQTETVGKVELDSANDVHELPTVVEPISELADTSTRYPTSTFSPSAEERVRRTKYEDEPLPRRGSIFAPEVAERGARGADYDEPQYSADTVVSPGRSCMSSRVPDSNSPCSSPTPPGDPRSQKIQELLAKRPRNLSIPLRDGKINNIPYLHPSHVPHLETLVLTDIPSHVPANSHILTSLTRFITACSNEALLATLQAGTDYSLPPGQARLRAEQEESRKLFALHRIVLEIVPAPKTASGRAKLTPWNPLSYQYGTSKSPLADRDSENLWCAAMNDFSFFDETECGIPDNDLGKYHFPMAALNEMNDTSVSDNNCDSAVSGHKTSELGGSSPSAIAAGRRARSDNDKLANDIHGRRKQEQQQEEQVAPQVDLVSELASFRRAKKIEYENLRRTTQTNSSDTTVNSSTSMPPPSSPSSLSRSPVSPIEQFVEGHWKGEVKIVRNPTPKGSSGMVDMYGNYFEKGYLYR